MAPNERPESYRDLPEWQEAQAAYLAENDDHDLEYRNRVEAAFRMREIARQWASPRRA